MNPHTERPQLVNVCLAPLTKCVACTSVCADDHQVDNLTSQHAFQRLKGFRVEHFIRPPVHIDFHFLAPVNIACVLVRPELAENSEISLTASVFSGTHTTPQHQMTLCGRGSVKGEGALLVFKNRAFERRYHSKIDLSSSSSVLGSHLTLSDIVKKSEEPFKDVSNVKHLKVTVNYFSGPKPVSLKWAEVWGTLGTSSSTCKEDITAARAAIAHLSGSGGKSVVNMSTEIPAGVAQQLKACCYGPKANCEVYKQTVPCSNSTMGRYTVGKKAETNHVEIEKEKPNLSQYQFNHFPNQQPPFPQPGSCRVHETVTASSSCGCTGTLKCSNHCGWHSVFSKHSSTATVQDGVLSERKTHFKPSRASTPATGSTGNTGTGRNSGGVTATVPEHFLDEITYELMALPMLLPSGHFVDRSTLDKLQHTDSMYGRPPSDPFTGVAFSECALPQFNVELKQQIDSFLSRHGPSVSHGMPSFGQTLGSAAEIVKHLSSIEKSVKPLLEDKANAGHFSTPHPPQNTWTLVETRKRARNDVMSCTEEVHRPLAKQSLTTKTLTGEGLSERETESSDVTSTQKSHHTPAATVEAGHHASRMSSQAHEVEVAASLDRELQDLVHR